MDYTQISIIKRDGKTEPFSLDKIVRAITKAFRAGGITDEGQAVEQIASDVAAAITKAEISVEEIQDMVEEPAYRAYAVDCGDCGRLHRRSRRYSALGCRHSSLCRPHDRAVFGRGFA